MHRRAVSFDGVSLHADVQIGEHDRAGLERLCRYGARPAFASERLALTASGQVSYRLKRPWPDGRTHPVLSPVAFLRRLAGILPPPRRHLVRYAGVFAPRAKRRARVVALAPAGVAQATATAADRAAVPAEPAAHAAPAAPTTRPSTRLPWADLLQRVFAEDVLACPCGRRRRVIAFITDTDVARQILSALRLPADIPTFAPARAPPQPAFDHWQGPAPCYWAMRLSHAVPSLGRARLAVSRKRPRGGANSAILGSFSITVPPYLRADIPPRSSG